MSVIVKHVAESIGISSLESKVAEEVTRLVDTRIRAIINVRYIPFLSMPLMVDILALVFHFTTSVSGCKKICSACWQEDSHHRRRLPRPCSHKHGGTARAPSPCCLFNIILFHKISRTPSPCLDTNPWSP